jgi:hypothetical protein
MEEEEVTIYISLKINKIKGRKHKAITIYTKNDNHAKSNHTQ